VEYRTWISLADMPFRDEDVWLPLTDHLEREYSQFGPIASWDDATTMVLILAHDDPDPAAAAEHATRVVSDSLHATGLGTRFPTVFQIEHATDLVPA
jgi:hypothetical protein